ncbi:MAG: adenine deaminase, partial [Bacteroidales bacterium]|nr:adenine deaminase [Bacteroidales bacterium]
NRYKKNAKPQVGFIKGFGISSGAIATSIAHDSHNIIAVGANDEEITKAINEIIENKGGMCYVKGIDYYTLPLEFGGIMTQQNCEHIGNIYKQINHIVKSNGCKIKSPFMTLSFMALPVIPNLKITDLGLFNSEKFEFTDLFI